MDELIAKASAYVINYAFEDLHTVFFTIQKSVDILKDADTGETETVSSTEIIDLTEYLHQRV